MRQMRVAFGLATLLLTAPGWAQGSLENAGTQTALVTVNFHVTQFAEVEIPASFPLLRVNTVGGTGTSQLTGTLEANTAVNVNVAATPIVWRYTDGAVAWNGEPTVNKTVAAGNGVGVANDDPFEWNINTTWALTAGPGSAPAADDLTNGSVNFTNVSNGIYGLTFDASLTTHSDYDWTAEALDNGGGPETTMTVTVTAVAPYGP